MISDSDALKLAAAITEMTGQEFSDAGARLFSASLNPRMDLNDVLRLLARWNTMPHSWHRVEPGDINELWRKSRPSSQLSEARIGELLAGTESLSATQYVHARRTLLDRINSGVGEERAAVMALESARTLAVEAPKPKPRREVGHHFIGNIGKTPLKDVLRVGDDEHDK